MGRATLRARPAERGADQHAGSVGGELQVQLPGLAAVPGERLEAHVTCLLPTLASVSPQHAPARFAYQPQNGIEGRRGNHEALTHARGRLEVVGSNADQEPGDLAVQRVRAGEPL